MQQFDGVWEYNYWGWKRQVGQFFFSNYVDTKQKVAERLFVDFQGLTALFES